jgi:hypothetical protein
LAWAIQKRLPKRQAVLLLLVLAAPCLVLTGLGLRMNRQERQLAQKRAEDEQQHRLALFRSDLLSGLESVKRQARAQSDTQAAAAMQKAKHELFNKIYRRKTA